MHTQAETAGCTLDGLDVALSEAGSVALSCLSRDQLGEWLCDLQSLRARMDALVCAATAQAHHAAVPALGGQRNVSSYVAANTSSDPKVVAADRNLGLWLDGFCEFADAFTAGVLTRRHVQALRSIDNRRTRTQLTKSQDYLIEAAQRCGWTQFEQVLRYWILTFDPDGDEPTEQHETRKLTVAKTTNGMVKGAFLLDPISGQTALCAIDQEAQRLYRQDTETEVERSHTQRYADALINLLARGATKHNATTPAPLVHIVMSQTVAEDTITRLHEHTPTNNNTGTSVDVDPHQLPLDPDHIDGRCELIDGTPIHPHWALTTLANADLRRTIFTPNSEICDLSRKTRLYPPHLKQALLIKARGHCQTPGCDAPYPWLQADHILAWTNNGPTNLTNGQILCDPHGPAP